MKTDLLIKFILDEVGIRGEFIVLGKTAQDVLSKQEYPIAVRNLLGQMACASMLLSGTLKIIGSTSIQAKGRGPLTSIMAEATHQNTCRGIALWHQAMPTESQTDEPGQSANPIYTENATLQSLLGRDSTLAITLTPTEGQRYQGIVSLEHDCLAACLESYFAQSEQLNTMIRLFQQGDYWGGLLLQQLPAEQDTSEFSEHWQTITHLTNTLSFSEMLDADHQTILHRLFHHYDVRILQNSPTRFCCSCSEQRTLDAIKYIGKQEAYSILLERGAIDIECQFCKQHYRFGQTKIRQLFEDPTLH